MAKFCVETIKGNDRGTSTFHGCFATKEGAAKEARRLRSRFKKAGLKWYKDKRVRVINIER